MRLLTDPNYTTFTILKSLLLPELAMFIPIAATQRVSTLRCQCQLPAASRCKMQANLPGVLADNIMPNAGLMTLNHIVKSQKACMQKGAKASGRDVCTLEESDCSWQQTGGRQPTAKLLLEPSTSFALHIPSTPGGRKPRSSERAKTTAPLTAAQLLYPSAL